MPLCRRILPKQPFSKALPMSHPQQQQQRLMRIPPMQNPPQQQTQWGCSPHQITVPLKKQGNQGEWGSHVIIISFLKGTHTLMPFKHCCFIFFHAETIPHDVRNAEVVDLRQTNPPIHTRSEEDHLRPFQSRINLQRKAFFFLNNCLFVPPCYLMNWILPIRN